LKELEELIKDALTNIGEDRSAAQTLLNDLMTEIIKQNTGSSKLEKHGRSGNTAAKYLEVMQKSNEQRIKIVSLMAKEMKVEIDDDLDDADIQNLLDDIQDEKDKDVK